MKKFRCTVCGYIHEGETAPEQCPLCKVGADKFEEIIESDEALTFADEHRLGVAQGCPEEIWKGLQDCYADMAQNVEKEYGVAIETIGAIGFILGLVFGLFDAIWGLISGIFTAIFG